MASFRAILALFALAAAHAAQGAQGYFSPSMAAVSGYKKADSSNNSTLYRIESNATAYDTAPYLAVLQGSRRTMGYDYAWVERERGDLGCCMGRQRERERAMRERGSERPHVLLQVFLLLSLSPCNTHTHTYTHTHTHTHINRKCLTQLAVLRHTAGR